MAVLETGGLDIRFLSRRANVSTGPSHNLTAPSVGFSGAPPLQVPQRSKLFAECAQRGIDDGAAMYTALQQCALFGLHELALTAAGLDIIQFCLFMAALVTLPDYCPVMGPLLWDALPLLRQGRLQPQGMRAETC